MYSLKGSHHDPQHIQTDTIWLLGSEDQTGSRSTPSLSTHTILVSLLDHRQKQSYFKGWQE